ncbi:hypothetical protein [Micromonospora vulcania]|uniref:Uncharacterized protein n=1 Tax=Micromonospora vulcania TaxID=1441873 RepID=A0ABW1H3U6_9ACTN
MTGVVLALGVLLAVGVGVAVLVRRRSKAATLTREDQLRLARRATKQIARANRKTRRGSLRGKGGGGSDSLAVDAAFGSGEGGTP